MVSNTVLPASSVVPKTRPAGAAAAFVLAMSSVIATADEIVIGTCIEASHAILHRARAVRTSAGMFLPARRASAEDFQTVAVGPDRGPESRAS